MLSIAFSHSLFLTVRGPTGACSLGRDKGGVSVEVPASRTGSPGMQLRGEAEAGSAASPSPAVVSAQALPITRPPHLP